MNHPDRTVRVLLVEDDEDDYLLTADLLASVPDTSYEVTWVANADQGSSGICRPTITALDS